jgi:DNA-binding LacI/PurR family transcriptional regulator
VLLLISSDACNFFDIICLLSSIYIIHYLTSPTLTTIHVPKELLGRRAVKFLSNKNKNGKDQYENVLLTCEMIVRELTTNPKENNV